MLLILLESTGWLGFNEGHLEVFRPKVWKILPILTSFLSFEIKLKK
jgi:hypothetical protein